MAPKKINIRKRMVAFYGIIVGCMVFLLCVTAYIQIIRGPKLRAEAESDQMRDSVISPKRGTIYDRNRKVLAQSASTETVCISPKAIDEAKNAEEVARNLSEILGLDYTDIYNKTQKKESQYAVIKKKVEKETADKIRELKLKGVSLQEDTKRYYPGGAFASHIIGFTGDDSQGLGGVELVYDNELKGVPGRIRTAKNANGTDMPYESEQYLDAVEGSDVVLCIDEVIQHFVENHLETARVNNQVADGAAAIVMNPKTGEILAMSTKPDFDLNAPFEITNTEVKAQIDTLSGEEYKKAYNKELFKEWRNKAVVDTYEPGSTFKAITASAALETGTSKLTDSFFCSGVKHVSDWDIKCHKTGGHGAEDFVHAVYNSCNPAFIDIGLKLGVHNFCQYFAAFGFTEKTGFDLPGEAVGSFYTEDNMATINLATSAFGQSQTVTPLQMINAMSAIANGGNLMKPYVIKQVVDADGNVIKNIEPTVVRRVISEETSKTMRSILEGVVSEGGGRNAYVAGYRIAGKTGTSEKLPRGSNTYIASFCGFAPADDPQIVCLVMLDNPQGGNYYGGMIAAPVVGSIIEDTLRYLGVEPQYTESESGGADIEMPEVRGKSLEEAKNALVSAGLKYRVIGSGDSIVDQTPKPGVGLSSGSVGILYTESGAEEMVTVSDLSGMSSMDCNIALANSGLNFKVSGPGKTEQASSARAAKQEPAAGSTVAAGTIVSVEFRYASIE